MSETTVQPIKAAQIFRPNGTVGFQGDDDARAQFMLRVGFTQFFLQAMGVEKALGQAPGQTGPSEFASFLTMELAQRMAADENGIASHIVGTWGQGDART
ncbi:hypothetical protein VK792_10025 [Mesobacterium sp. TK19101]|uniref:Uncharacterized protein n=1 Tax=Mesobacterium hydrothermale TaxID=3111907 RepID=A0ABU6HI86_9RHOB|nr:hypothetical protein [Mesobacterium sp. TK19101]MEC3861621.1 hypothetical protein [Mesobacterium sp. TK19101]